MAFIRKRRSSRNRFSFQVLESYREHGKTRKRTLHNECRDRMGAAFNGIIERRNRSPESNGGTLFS
jgi:hypothetical protein